MVQNTLTKQKRTNITLCITLYWVKFNYFRYLHPRTLTRQLLQGSLWWSPPDHSCAFLIGSLELNVALIVYLTTSATVAPRTLIELPRMHEFIASNFPCAYSVESNAILLGRSVPKTGMRTLSTRMLPGLSLSLTVI